MQMLQKQERAEISKREQELKWDIPCLSKLFYLIFG